MGVEIGVILRIIQPGMDQSGITIGLKRRGGWACMLLAAEKIGR